MRISDWSSNVSSADLPYPRRRFQLDQGFFQIIDHPLRVRHAAAAGGDAEIDIPEIRHLRDVHRHAVDRNARGIHAVQSRAVPVHLLARSGRSEEHTSELQSLMRISYAVFCLKKKQT